MNSKFYVSLEAARLLKEKGYDEPTEYLHVDDIIYKGICLNYLKPELCGGMIIEDNISYPCPTKAEAIDWLESKRMRINIIYDWIECKWYFTIINGSPTVKSITELEVSDSVFYKTRLEAEEAAIIKALELL